MAAYLIAAILAWIPPLVLTGILIRHEKALMPVFTGLSESVFNVVCMDKRIWEDLTRGEGWRLPGGAYAFGLPVIWTGAVWLLLNWGWGALAFIFAGFAIYQFFFAAPMIVLGLSKAFFIGLLTDENEGWLETHPRTCKAVVITDPVALTFFIAGKAIPGRDPFEGLYDLLTILHWIDIAPFLVTANVVSNIGRLGRRIFIRNGDWMIIHPGSSVISEH